MDYVEHFHRDTAAFADAARRAAAAGCAPAVPSCPGWTMTDLVLHLGVVHRFLAQVIAERRQQPPQRADRAGLGLPAEQLGWLPPGHAPANSPVPPGLTDWFSAGAAALESQFRAAGPDEQVWTWSADKTVGFWRRMQAIEAAVHRWDAENAVGAAQPIHAALAADAISQTFDVMVPMRRAIREAPPGAGEQYLFRRTDGPGEWVLHFDGEAVRTTRPDAASDGEPARPSAASDGDPARSTGPDGHAAVELAGTASDLALFLWQRVGAARCEVRGDASLLDRYFVLVPPQ